MTKSGRLSPSDPAVKKKFDSFKSEVCKEATYILTERMPQKILYFNALVSEKQSPTSDCPIEDVVSVDNPWKKFIPDAVPPLYGAITDGVDADGRPTLLSSDETENSATKRRKITREEFLSTCTQDKSLPKEAQINPTAYPAHPQIYKMTEEIKKEVAELIEMAGTVKLYIQLNVPRIEGGNNFGVQIQEEAIQELSRVEDAAFSVCSAIVEYFTGRATLVAKIIKYPNVQDYKEALRELDEKKWMLLKVTRIDMRNNYAMLYDLLSKNWERVVQPRSHDGATSMIY